MNLSPILPSLWLVCLLACQACAAGSTPAVEHAPSDRAALPAGVHALRGTDLSLPTDDLAPLEAIVGDARLVGLGETAHRSGGILGAKNRVIRHLVEVQGFRVVGIETEFTDAEGADAWIRTCAGDPRQVVREHIRETWHDATTVELLEWLCAFNQAHPEDPVTLIGFNNMQPWHDTAALLGFVREHMPDELDRLTPALDGCFGAAAGSSQAFREQHDDDDPTPMLQHCLDTDDLSVLQTLTPGTLPDYPDRAPYSRCLGAIDEIDAALDDLDTGEPDLARARVHAKSLRGWEDWNCMGPTPQANGSRDRAMAAILLHQLEVLGEDKRAVISAHSLHLNERSTDLEVRFPPPLAAMGLWEGTTRMGVWLDEALGDDYCALSFHASRHALADAQVAPLPADVLGGEPPLVEAVLHDLGQPMLLVDLAAGGPFATDRSYRVLYPLDVGATAVVEVPLARQFRGLVYLDEAEPWSGLGDAGP